MKKATPQTHHALHPFSRLSPDLLLAAVDSVGLRSDGRLLALGSYENRVWQVGIETDEFVVIKVYRPARWRSAQILEEHDFVAELQREEIPAVAPLRFGGRTLHQFAGFEFAIYPRQGGRAPELDDPAVLEWLGRLMARIHNVGARRAFVVRETLNIERFGFAARDWLAAQRCVPEEISDAWSGVVEQALAGVQQCYAQVGAYRLLRTHGDCHAGNVLWTPADREGRGGGPHFVDFDDARMAPAVQDLWMLLSGEEAQMQAQLRHVLRGYESLREFNRAELGLIEALRTLRLLHHCAWLARRWDDPAFPAAFPWFAMPRYWEERMLELREQVERMASSTIGC